VTTEQAKTILLLYRSMRDREDADIKAALEQVERDPELQKWFDVHCAHQRILKQRFSELPVDPRLRDAIIAGRKVVRPNFRPLLLAAAAAIVLFLGASALWLRPSPFERFDLYRSRIVSTVWREYQMDITTNDLAAIRTYLRKSQAPSGYSVPPALEQLKPTGGGRLKWGDHPVAMICFEREDTQMVFLFVVDRRVLKGEPERPPQLWKVDPFQTLSWSDTTNTYVLAGPNDPAFFKKLQFDQ
jgi:hypothetical protein